jgi:hypothetical protein
MVHRKLPAKHAHYERKPGLSIQLQMKSLKQIIDELPEHQWNYYFGLNVSIHKPASFSASFSFLESYFKNAEKLEILGLNSYALNDSDSKVEHSVSIYFLGCFLAAQLNLKNQLNKASGYNNLEEHFLFVWFLASLYHDRHFQIEQQREVKDYATFISSITAAGQSNLLTRNKTRLIPQTLQKTIRSYYTYRQKHWHVTDHGIAAGLYLFNDLVNLRKINEGKNTKLDFSKKVENLYKEAAWAIAAHNIYFPEEKDHELYSSYKLKALLKHPAISFSDAPFLFLLGLVDTIDPIKTYHCCDADTVANLIHLQFETTETHYILKMKIDPPLDFNLMTQKKPDVERWLNITFISDQTSRSINITVPYEVGA